MKSKVEQIDFQNSIGPWLGKTTKITNYYMQEMFDQMELDMTKEQMITLKIVFEFDGLNQNELASKMFRDKSSLARLLSKMEKKGYILRKQFELDKRVNEVFITDKGIEVYKQTMPVLAKFIRDLEKNISDKEKKQLIKILKKVQFNFTQERTAL